MVVLGLLAGWVWRQRPPSGHQLLFMVVGKGGTGSLHYGGGYSLVFVWLGVYDWVMHEDTMVVTHERCVSVVEHIVLVCRDGLELVE